MKIVLLNKSNEVIREIDRAHEPHPVLDLVEYWDKHGNHGFYVPRSTSEDMKTIFYKQVDKWAMIDESPSSHDAVAVRRRA